MMRDMSKEETLARWPNPPDYEEILRLWRRYSRHEKEPLHSVFVRIGQQLEKTKPPRCKSCLYTDAVYSRLTDFKCTDPFHTEKTDAPPAAVIGEDRHG